MAISEKQAIVLGVGGVAVLYLMKSKGMLLAAGKKPGATTAAGRSPAMIPSSAARPSTNIATGSGTRTTPQNPSIRVGGVQVPTSVVGGLFGALASIFGGKAATLPKPQAPGAAPKASSGGGGGPAGGSSGGKAQTGPGNNPWSDGSFVGQSSVSGNSPGLNGTLQGYDTGVSSGEYADVITPVVSPSGSDALAQAREGMNADGTSSDEPPALGYDDGGEPIYNPTPDVLPSTSFNVYGYGDDGTAAGDATLGNDAGVFTDTGVSGPIDVAADVSADAGALPDTSYDGDAGLGGGLGFNDDMEWGE